MTGTVRKQDKKKKEITGSNRKSSLRSSSKSSLASDTTQSSGKSFQTKNKEKKDPETFKTIYKSSDEKVEKDEDPNLTVSIIAWFQGAISIYVISAIIFQLINGEENGHWFVLMEVLVLELFGVAQLLMLARRRYTGTTCFFLSTQFVLLFLLFSLFLHSTYNSRSSFLERAFGISAVSLMSSGLHFFIVAQSIQLIKESTQRNDYSEKVIVEGVEKRRKDLYLMISDLISEICYDDRDLKVNLKIRDETGQPKSMRGAGVEAGVSRVLEMSTDGQRVKLSTSNTTLACINVPKHHHHHKHHKKGHHSKNHHNNSDLPPMIDAKYNNCEKQEKMLSPRKILN